MLAGSRLRIRLPEFLSPDIAPLCPSSELYCVQFSYPECLFWCRVVLFRNPDVAPPPKLRATMYQYISKSLSPLLSCLVVRTEPQTLFHSLSSEFLCWVPLPCFETRWKIAHLRCPARLALLLSYIVFSSNIIHPSVVVLPCFKTRWNIVHLRCPSRLVLLPS